MPRSATRFSLSVLFAAAAIAAPASALAQSEEGFDKAAEDSIAGKEQEEAEKGAKMPGEKAAAPEPEDPIMNTVEDPKKAYRFINLRFRDIIVPKFMINIFADGGATVNAFTFGPEFTSRKDGTEWNIALSYADYSMDPFIFKGHDDGEIAYERVSSTMKVLILTIDLLYDIPIDKKGHLDFLIGGGVGIGGVLGNLYRNQVVPNKVGASPDKNADWEDCTGPNLSTFDPSPTQHYCGAENQRYGPHGERGYAESSWANGGSKPFIFPWISLPQLSLRYKPIRDIQTRADVGFSITGFFWGLSAGYLLPI